MFNIVILSCLVACVVAKPGLTHGITAPIAVAAPAVSVVTPHVIAPSAVSQQSRHDIIHPGIITYTTAHVAPVIAATPLLTTVPAVRVSSAATSRLDVRRPVVAGIAATPVALGSIGHAGGLGRGFGFGAVGISGGIGLGGIGSGGIGSGGIGSGGIGLGGQGYGK